MPTIRISDLNYQRLQQFAVPLEDTPNSALNRVLSLAEAGKRAGLSAEPKDKTERRPFVDVDLDRLDTKLAAKLSGIAVPVKKGKHMTRWEHTQSGESFWLTTQGSPILYLPRRGSWPSDTDHQVVHHPLPKSGWDRYDRLFLRNEEDIDCALRVLGDLDIPRK
jgi:hypothetical protein